MSRRHSPRDERGLAILAALMCILVVVSLSAAAVATSLGSLASTSQNRNSLLSVDAATAGVDAELATLKSQLAGTVAGAAIPCTRDWTVTLDQSSAGRPDVATPAESQVGFVPALEVSTSGAPTMGSRLPAAYDCPTSSTVPTSTAPWWILVQAEGNVAAKTGGNGRTVQAVVEVADTSNAQAQAISLNLLNGTTQYSASNPPTSASNNGSGPNSPTIKQPTITIPGADSFVKVTAAAETAEANTNGSSYACAGDGASFTPSCSLTGADGGVSLDLSGLPGVGAALSSLVADLKLNFDGIASNVSLGPNGTSASGSASLLDARVTVTLLGRVVVGPLELNLTNPVTSATQVVPLIVSALSENALTAPLASAVGNALNSTVKLTAGYWAASPGCSASPASSCVVTETGLQVALLQAGVATGATASLATSQAGPNASNDSLTVLGFRQAK